METMAEITIEKDVTPVLNSKEFYEQQMDSMNVGDSFSFPFSSRALINSLITIGYHTYTKKRFQISIKGQPKGTARVWRLKDSEE